MGAESHSNMQANVFFQRQRLICRAAGTAYMCGRMLPLSTQKFMIYPSLSRHCVYHAVGQWYAFVWIRFLYEILTYGGLTSISL